MSKQNKNIFVILLILISSFFVNNDVFAAGEHVLELSAVVCDSDIYNNSVATTNYNNCYKDYKAGKLSTYLLANGSDINPGTTIMVITTYRVGSDVEVTSMQANINYDPTIWTLGVNAKGVFYKKTDTSSFTQENDDGYSANWYNDLTASTNKYGESLVTVVADEQSGDGVAQDSDVEIGYFFMTLADSASGNVGLNFSTRGGDNFLSDVNGDKTVFNTNSISLNVPGEALSKDASLGSLSITNSDTAYILDPSFTAGSVENKVYNTVVPYDISQIMINATTNDAGANILPADLGKKTLSLGMNTFTIGITSAFGNVETYTVNIYRLSNDASLSSITLTNGVSFGNMISGQYTYSTSVTYATSSTSISATPTHTNAFVDSGEGTWNLTNFGTQTNTKTIVVKAENCKSEYSSVPGNTCTVQNYNLTINRDAPSTNAYLKNITVDTQSLNQFSNGKVTFNKTILEYDLGEVAYDKTSVNLNALVDDTGKSKVSGLGNKTLNVGENTFNIDVVAEDGSTTLTYTVKIYRLSNDSLLKSLKVESVPQTSASIVPSFNSEINSK